MLIAIQGLWPTDAESPIDGNQEHPMNVAVAHLIDLLTENHLAVERNREELQHAWGQLDIMITSLGRGSSMVGIQHHMTE